MQRYQVLILFLLGLWMLCVERLLAEDPIRDAVVKIQSTQLAPDYQRPWAKSSPTKSGGSGVIVDVDGLHVLTNAHVVRFASQIYVQPNSTTEKYAAEIVAIAPGIDLALLKIKDPEVLAEQSALQLSDELPSTKDTVNVYGFPIGGDDLSVTEGIVSRIEFSRYYFGDSGTRIQVDAALNPGNSGGPAVVEDKIVGLVFSGIRDADNIGYLIPAQEIRMFLRDIADGSYQGKPKLFDRFQVAENEALRNRLSLGKETTGVIITKPYRKEDSYPLKRWDVITKIGPHKIDNQGLVQLRNDLRLRFHYFIPQLVKEGNIELAIVRDGQRIQVQVPVEHKMELLLPRAMYDYPEYAIYGPLVFTTATLEIGQSMTRSSRWLALLANRRSPLISRMMDKPQFPGEQLVIVPTGMFSHPINKGYANPSFQVVSHLNDEPVKNLAHLVELLRDFSGEYVEFTFAGQIETLIFRHAEVVESSEIILEAEGIRHQFSPRLRKIWNAGK
ncbi:MAG: peptidase S1 [Planctomycetaceae bacterium]|nr:peptidase S1 [Planctomycetaceae bacterium]